MARTIYSLAIDAAKKEKPWQQKQKRVAPRCTLWQRSTLVMTIAATMLAMSPARAGLPPGMDVFDHADVISDAALGHMRGRFVAAGQVMHFGVEMVTQWLTASGQTIIASGNLQVNLAGSAPQVGFKPTITVQQNAATGGANNQGTTSVSGGDGLQNVNGVVQNIQVAGISNGVTNSIGINVKASSAQPDMQPLSASSLNASTTTANGSVATVSLGSNGMNVAVMVPDQGRAIQQIRNVGMNGGQVLQSVQLGGNINQIQNRINISVQMNAGFGLASHAGNLLQAMRMIPQHSSF